MSVTRKRSGLYYIVLPLIFLLVAGYSNYTVYKKFMHTEAGYQQTASDGVFKYELKAR